MARRQPCKLYNHLSDIMQKDEAKKIMSGSWECNVEKAGCLDPLSHLIYPKERGDMIFDNKVAYIPSALQ